MLIAALDLDLAVALEDVAFEDVRRGEAFVTDLAGIAVVLLEHEVLDTGQAAVPQVLVQGALVLEALVTASADEQVQSTMELLLAGR